MLVASSSNGGGSFPALLGMLFFVYIAYFLVNFFTRKRYREVAMVGLALLLIILLTSFITVYSHSASVGNRGSGQTTTSIVLEPYKVQAVDYSFDPWIEKPRYVNDDGPIVLVDAAHGNFHTIDGSYRPFADVLEKDGHIVVGSKKKISGRLLNTCEIFVISVAGVEDTGSAFTGKEIETLEQWVKSGGSALLIVDGGPGIVAMKELAAAFCIKVNNGYVAHPVQKYADEPIVFARDDKSLVSHSITKGSGKSEKVESVATFLGTAFKACDDFEPLMVLQQPYELFTPNGKGKGVSRMCVDGWYQGGVLEYGKGRLGFFAEAGMFTAQTFTPKKIIGGMNHPKAKGNVQFLLNLVHWLNGE
ncbi:MAG: hypothetical protein GY869_25755 [Planctomycetes bacterium]|nr:hypothetical protein [Planctomycetota bacterium]